MADSLSSLSDKDLRAKLLQYGLADIPITKTTKDLVIRKLKTAMESNGSSQHEEPVASESRSSSVRRRSTAAQPAKPKTRQRASLAAETKTDESDGYEEPRRTKQNTPRTEKKSVTNGKSQTPSNSSEMTDEELLKQLAKHSIPAPAITHSTKPILIKKLNHAIAKQRRESKTFTPPPPPVLQDTDQDSSQESDCPDTSSFVSAKDRRTLTPSLSFSQQHSLTIGSSISYSDSLLKPRLSDFPKPYIPQTTIINRFVEEQEPYDTGSDSENDSGPVKITPKKSWSFSSWFPTKTTQTLGTPVKKPSLISRVCGKLNILWQWQFIAVVLPLLAVLFFLLLAAFYIRASYNEPNPSQGDTFLDQSIQMIKNHLEKDAASKLCGGEEVVPLLSSQLLDQLQINMTLLNRVKDAASASGINVDEDSWSVPGARLPLWCLIKTYLWNISVASLFIIFGFGGVVLIHQLVTANCRQREKEEQEVYSLVEMIIDLLARHQSAMVSNGRPQDAFLAITHVRDVLIPLKERKTKLKLWNKAIQFLEDNESRVRPEIQQIEGEDFRVWRWLPPSTTFSPGNKAPDQTDEAAGSSTTNSTTPRPKVWQGQAFSTDSTGVNSPPPYPLTQCLKVRNMFDAEVEVGDAWPVRIQDAILEKADKGKILHMAVDRGSREGCVYIKCCSAEEAGKVYRSLHGWWFDGNLVTVKYLRPERYQYRFPDSAKATIPLQPSNDKRLSLQTKFWKSPLEHF